MNNEQENFNKKDQLSKDDTTLYGIMEDPAQANVCDSCQ